MSRHLRTVDTNCQRNRVSAIARINTVRDKHNDSSATASHPSTTTRGIMGGYHGVRRLWCHSVLTSSPRRRDRRLGETHSSPQPRQNAVSIARSESPRICTLWLLSMVRSLLVLSLVKVDFLALALVAVILPTSPCGCYPWFWHGSLISICLTFVHLAVRPGILGCPVSLDEKYRWDRTHIS